MSLQRLPIHTEYSGPLDRFIATIIDLGGTATKWSSYYVNYNLNGLFGDNTDRTANMSNNSTNSSICWIDTDNGFFCSTNAGLNYLSNYQNGDLVGTTSSIFDFLCFKDKNGILRQSDLYTYNSTSKHGGYKNAPYYLYEDLNDDFCRVTNMPNQNMTTFSASTYNFTLLPFYIGHCRVPNMYYSLDNYCAPEQIIKFNNRQFKCLNSFMFYEVL